MEPTPTTVAQTAVKPKFRGRLHQVGFFVSIPMGFAIVIAAPTAKAKIAVAIYSVCISLMLGTSALFHVHNWTPEARRVMRRMDHAMIFAAVAGTYTPIAVLALHGTTQTLILWLVWVGGVLGAIQQLVWIDAPKWATAVVYLAIGWVAVAAVHEIYTSSGPWALGLIILGGILYSMGAVVYALRKPNPKPQIFGYHEVFHALVLAALISHYIAICFITLNG
ncbi:MAG: hemolysin III family protein [Acidimicrobiaceae bacterium]|nr:hemolysin III family protein [Acidimicrobiaceae bacterium]